MNKIKLLFFLFPLLFILLSFGQDNKDKTKNSLVKTAAPGTASVNIEAGKKNVLYIGVDNPVRISGQEKISSVTISQGTIVNKAVVNLNATDYNYTARPENPGEVTINVFTVLSDGKRSLIGTGTFPVKNVPDPEASIARKKPGDISKRLILAQAGLMADLNKFELEGVRFKITSFEMVIQHAGQDPVIISSDSYLFSSEMFNKLSKTVTGDRVDLKNIKCSGPGGRTGISLDPVSYIITDDSSK